MHRGFTDASGGRRRYDRGITASPIIPFWFGGSAPDEDATAFCADDHNVTAVTAPDFASTAADRPAITGDRTAGILEAIRPVVDLVVAAVHIDSWVSMCGSSDRVLEQITAVDHVESDPITGALDPDFYAVDEPQPSRAGMAVSSFRPVDPTGVLATFMAA